MFRNEGNERHQSRVQDDEPEWIAVINLDADRKKKTKNDNKNFEKKVMKTLKFNLTVELSPDTRYTTKIQQGQKQNKKKAHNIWNRNKNLR